MEGDEFARPAGRRRSESGSQKETEQAEQPPEARKVPEHGCSECLRVSPTIGCGALSYDAPAAGASYKTN
jgi:hypothetical protein